MLDLIDGSIVSDCRLPCKTTHTQTKYLHENKGQFTRIDIAFSSRVRITKTDLVQPTLSSFLSEITLKILLGWGVHGTLAGSGGDPALSAFSELPPVGHHWSQGWTAISITEVHFCKSLFWNINVNRWEIMKHAISWSLTVVKMDGVSVDITKQEPFPWKMNYPLI